LQAWPVGQSVATLQPQTPLARQAVPVVLPAQSTQAPPLLPHAVSLAPAPQVPLVAAEQQPPLQAWVELQSVVHRPAPVSQAMPVGQSLVWVQASAHCPPAGGPVTAAQDRRLAVQSVQAPPSAPQVVSAVPTLHWLELQQPPLQMTAAEQAVPQTWEPGLQA